jgi:hypothetical protein
LWEALEVEARRREFPEAAIFALAQAAIGGGVSAPLYQSTAMVDAREAADTLERLAKAGLLVAARRGSEVAYAAADTVKAIYARTRDAPLSDPDPFA